MLIILLSLMAGLVLVGIFWAAAASRYGNAGVLILAIVAAFFAMCLVSLAHLFQASLTAIAALGCLLCGAHPKVIRWMSIGAMVVSFGFLTLCAMSELAQFKGLRRQHPLESVASRLKYETPMANDQAVPAMVLAGDVENHLREQEIAHRYNRRSYALRNLHSLSVNHFALAMGFGPVRTIGMRMESIELPAEPPIPLPLNKLAYSPDSAAAFSMRDPPPSLAPNRSELWKAHQSGTADFLSPESMGYVAEKQRVAGFVSHRFRTLPKVLPEGEPAESWQVVRLELISLLKHATPVAYVSEHLPQMDELRDAPTRPLNLFEQQAVKTLHADEDLLVEEAPPFIHLVGSVRAGEQCLQCHQVERGTLLGAFSYDLAPTKSLSSSRTNDTPPPTF